MTEMRYPAKIGKLYLFKLSIPIFFSNIAIPLVGLIDTSLMGHLGDARFLAATSISTSVITMIFWSFGFLRMGTVGLVSQSLGRGDYREIVRVTVRNLIIAFIFGIVIFFLKDKILFAIQYFFKPSYETQILIIKYISIRIFSAPAELSLYVLVGLFLGLQLTKISSSLISFFCLLNILFSLYFVIYLNLDIYGVALGTLLSAYLSAILFIFYTYFFFKRKFNIKLTFKGVFVKKKIIRLFNINFDIFIRTILITFSFLWFTYQSSKLGEDYLAVNTILMQFIMMSSFFLDSYAFSTEGVVGFSIGRKVKKSFLLIVENSIKLSFISSLFISLIYLIFFKNLIGYITDLDYIKFLTFNYIVWIILMPPVASFCYQLDGIFIGASQTVEMRNSMIISAVIFVFISIYLLKNFGNHGLWLSLMIFMILRSLSLRLYFSNILKKF